MPKTRLAVMLIALVAFLSSPAAAGEDGFACLFNGKDLSGWITGPDNAWVVDDGIIALKREFDGREHNLDYLWTEEKYGNFILELEFKVPEKANSGIFLRTPDLKNPVYTGIEVQVSNSYGREQLTSRSTAGAIYDCLAPTANAVKKPGQWNRYRITCRDNLIQVELNGKRVLDMDLDLWTELKKNPDGTENKFPKPLKEFARTGHIGFQDHGRPIWYRNIQVKRLD